MILDPPTPLQWQTLEESVLLHQQYLKEQLSATNQTSSSIDDDTGTSTTVDGDSALRTTGVDAAPLVAVIDDVTGKGYVTSG